jgi:hypothetical protein
MALIVLLVTVSAGFGNAAEKPAAPVAVDHAEQMTRGRDLFSRHVRALLTERCLRCHGGEKTKGGLDLRLSQGQPRMA